MARSNQWWKDDKFLADMELDAMYDPMTDEYVFQKSTVTIPIKRYSQRISASELERGYMTIDIINHGFTHLEKNAPDYRHEGPSNEELAKYPALRAAWQEFKVIHRLTVASKGMIK